MRGNPINRLDPLGLLDIFIGGAHDSNSGIVQGYAASFSKNNPGRNALYFSHGQLNKILAAIKKAKCDNPNDPINLVGHSWGGDTAADIAAMLMSSGNLVDLLVTVDPVSRSQPNLSDTTFGARNWMNINAAPSSTNGSDFIAFLGGKWGNSPAGFADTHFSVNTNHANFRAMMSAPGNGGMSAINALLGSNSGSSFSGLGCECPK